MLKELVDIVGEQNVSNAPEDLVSYSRDMVSPFSGEFLPEYIVLPESVEEVQEVLRLANKHRIPVYPYTFGTNAAGYTLPIKGGMVLCLKKLDRILSIDEEAMAAIIEPGVTWRRLSSEARRFGLQPTLPLGPYTGSPIASFTLWNITGHATRFGADRVVSLELVLPNGDILRTGSSAFPGHEIKNPFFRYAYGPDLTGLFRGSFGAYGIVTKAAYQLYPIGEREEHVDAQFDDLVSLLEAIRTVERLDISKYTIFYNRGFLVQCCAPHIDQLKNPIEVRRLGEKFPQWLLTMGMSGTKEQVDLYSEMFFDEVLKYGGEALKQTEEIIQERMDDLIPGASRSINRMYEPHGAAASIVAVAPISSILSLSQIADDLVKEFDIKDPQSGRLLNPPAIGYPYERGRNFYFEKELSFDPLDKESIEKIKRARRAWVKRMIPLGGSLMMLNPVYAEWLMPAYCDFLKSLKKELDPNNILSPDKLVSIEKRCQSPVQ